MSILKRPRIFLLTAMLSTAFAGYPILGQQSANVSAPGGIGNSVGVPKSRATDDRYHIGPSDVISIQVFGKPQLSRDEQVDSHGKIRMPLLDEDIQAACMTEDSLGEDIARRYREHELLRNPTVYVSVKEYQSQPVAVLGAVNLPGKFILKRPVRLREMLVFFAGGPNPKAGAKVQILSTVQDSMCTQEGEAPSTADAKAEPSFAVYDLQELLSGLESADPPIRRGDIINVPSAEEAYVIGNVQHPTTIPIIEPITLTRAVAIAGGFLPNSKKDKIRILRQVPGNSVGTEILVDLNSKDKNMGSDYLLRGGDIVEVSGPTGFQKVMLDMSKVFLPTLTSMPYRAIP